MFEYNTAPQASAQSAVRTLPSEMFNAWLGGKDLEDAVSLSKSLTHGGDDGAPISATRGRAAFSAKIIQCPQPIVGSEDLWRLPSDERLRLARQWAQNASQQTDKVDEFLEVCARLRDANKLHTKSHEPMTRKLPKL